MTEDALPGLTDQDHELAPLTAIRTETALSRFPIHRLAKRGDVQIEIRNQVAALLWEVTYNSKFGQPGPLAYKLDTLVVNRRIEEAGRPIPKLIRLGSLRDICRELGNSEGGDSIQAVRRALLQNASAFITARLQYRTADRTERMAEFADTRYGVTFTGERLPNGEEADAVYLELHDNYRAILESAQTRPLDYEYMKALPPAAQRFYEIVSYQVYAALHFQNERAKIRYSEYCLLSTATRYFDFDHVKKQMYKTHRPHLESGYLARVNYESTVDEQGRADWLIYYLPGPNAAREFREFTNSTRKKTLKGKRPTKGEGSIPAQERLLLPFPEPAAPARASELPALSDEAKALVEKLIAADLNRADAERLARERPEACQRQLQYLPFKTDLGNPGAYLRAAIEGDFAPPPEYRAAEEQKRRARQKEEEAKSRMASEALRMAQEARDTAWMEESLSRLEIEAPEAFQAFLAFREAEREETRVRYARMPGSIQTRMLAALDAPERRLESFRKWLKQRESGDTV